MSRVIFLAEPAGKARQRSPIAKQIWLPIDPRNFGCDVIFTWPSVRTYVRPSGQTLREREGEGSPKTTRREGGENTIFSWREIARCFWASGVFLGEKSHDHRRFWKRGFFKGLSFFSKTIVREYWSTWQKKTSNIYNWKEKVQKNTGRRRKVQVTKAPFKGLYRFVFFTAESLPCSET